MNRRPILIITILFCIALMFAYKLTSSQKVIKDVIEADLYPLSQSQSQWISSKERLVIGVTDDSVPMIRIDSDGEGFGLLADYISLISEGYGIKTVYTQVSNGELEQKLVNKEIDVAVSMHDPDLSDSISYTVPVVKVKGTLMYRRSLSLIESDTGAGLSVLVPEGDPSVRALRKNYPDMDFLFTKNVEEASRRLKAGEAEGIAGSEHSINYFLGIEYISDLLRAEGYTFDKGFCLAVSKDNNTLFDILNNAIYNMNNAGVISNLQSKWLGTSYSLYEDSAIGQMGIVILILFTAVLCVYFVFYRSNKSLYEELQERMELLIESQNEMQTTFDGVTYYLAEVSKEGRIININKAFSQHFNVRRRNVIGTILTQALNAEEEVSKKISTLINATFREEKEHTLEFSIGRGIYIAHTFTIMNNRNKVGKILLMITDVTDQRSMERQMLQDNKMIAVGQLAAGIAHEIRNPLGLIRNYCYVLKEIDKEDTETWDEAIKVIEKSVDKSVTIIENLLQFSRMTSNKKTLSNLYVHISNIIDLQRNWLDKRSIYVYYRFTGPHDVVVNAEAVEHILANLMSNAADAISAGSGRIDITCSHEEKKQIVLTVSDDGEGIPPEIKADIFNPFFTTKKRREGNGLGLYIVYSEVTKMEGDIKVDSLPGKGTKFTITIPID